jgi:hypothetical protein
LKATAKAVAKDAIGLAIEGQVSNEIGLDALAHDAQSRCAPDQLPLAFGQTIAAAKVVSHALDKIPEPARRLRAAVQAIDAKKLVPFETALLCARWRLATGAIVSAVSNECCPCVVRSVVHPWQRRKTLRTYQLISRGTM